MGCCVDFATAKASIETIIQRYCDDYKLFAARRVALEGKRYKMIVGIVVLPDAEKNTQMFEALLLLQYEAGQCVKVIESTIDKRDSNMVDLFLLEVTIEAS